MSPLQDHAGRFSDLSRCGVGCDFSEKLRKKRKAFKKMLSPFVFIKAKTAGFFNKPAKTALLAVLTFLIVISGFFAWRWAKGQSLEAGSNDGKWKHFSEDRFGFQMDYPRYWKADHAYERYAAGMLDLDLNNKKKGTGSGCGFEYIDVKIFVGNKDEAGRANDLKSQLYREIETIKNSGKADLVEKIDVEGMNVYKVKSDAPTLSLNGSCPGPLYLIDTGGKAFVYIFAGMGEGAKERWEMESKRIISSIKTD